MRETLLLSAGQTVNVTETMPDKAVTVAIKWPYTAQKLYCGHKWHLALIS